MDIIVSNILPFATIIVILVVIHELGHFVTAKLAGVQVLEFGIGYPPKLFGVKFGKRYYTVEAKPGESIKDFAARVHRDTHTVRVAAGMVTPLNPEEELVIRLKGLEYSYTTRPGDTVEGVAEYLLSQEAHGLGPEAGPPTTSVDEAELAVADAAGVQQTHVMPGGMVRLPQAQTEYTVNLLPLGGFVRLLGEEDPSDPRSLAAQPAWTRLVVMGSGSFMNFILAIALFAGALMIPREVQVGQAVITQVVPASPAERAGLKSGDIIQEIDGRQIDNVADASYNIRLNLGEDTDIVVKRTDPLTGAISLETVQVKPRWAPPAFEYVVQPGDTVDKVALDTGFSRDAVRQAAGITTALPVGEELTIQVGVETFYHTVEEGETVAFVARNLRLPDAAVAAAAGLPDQDNLTPGSTLNFQQGATGIVLSPQYPYTESRALGPWAALKRGWQSTFDSLKLARNEIISWTKGGTKAPVSGPIGIAQATGEVVREAGWKSLVDMAALLSINLAILNSLPLPMLDGGRMAFVVIEVLRRGKRIAPAKEALVHLVGMAALLVLVVVLSYFDVARIVRGDSLFR